MKFSAPRYSVIRNLPGRTILAMLSLFHCVVQAAEQNCARQFRRQIQEAKPPMNLVSSQTGENTKPILRRIVPFVLSSAGGVLVGMSGDLLGPMRFDACELLGALLMSPVLVTFGGEHVTIPWARSFFFCSGMAFLPGYVLLLALWLRKPFRWLYPIVFIWCAMGFFQLCHRLLPMMSA